ncbi:hypothetical protein FG93_01820 [Bosea sp. LC85]|uniref:hypothetical protein n=1 Tax=Bosea sp. LC85 TaxID=1502851 RepID=UPI0004E3A197|nr:hypothetical protein [Bosea sp. LC85]KFC73078.1 hypothetical protein FG93_01820 [Bosea sp. LC85]
MTNGCAAWQGIEDFAVILLYPNYEAIRQLLPWRSYSAIRHRVRRLDIARRRHIWTAPEISRLTAAFRDGASNDELTRLFPDLRPGQYLGKAQHIGLPKRRPKLIAFDCLALRDIRSRAAEVGFSLRDLDRKAGTGQYFQRSTRRICLRSIVRAVALLGGEVALRQPGSK